MITEINYTFSFEKLEVWQLSKKITINIYHLTETFPDKEKFGLSSQLRRAAVSVSSNIAEGSARKSLKDQAYMMERAFGSAVEIICQLIICCDLKYISNDELQESSVEIEKLTNKLNAYIKQLRRESNQQIIK